MSTVVLHTARLDLIPTTLEHLRVELETPSELGALLDAIVLPSWPPGLYDRDAMLHFRERLVEGGEAVALWYGWYALARTSRELVASAGFMGPPKRGLVEIGYSVVPERRRLGYATELVEALAAHALQMPGVDRVIGHVKESNVTSQRVLERCGFVGVGTGSEPGHDRFERRSHP